MSNQNLTFSRPPGPPHQLYHVRLLGPSSLTSLAVDRTKIGCDGAFTLAGALPSLPHLSRLTMQSSFLTDNGRDHEGAEALADSMAGGGGRALRYVDLSRNVLGVSQGMVVVAVVHV